MCCFGDVSVEPEGFEPSSKQAITRLSTCLVQVQFSMHDRPRTAYRTLSFFSLGFLSKPQKSGVDFYGAPKKVAVNKGYQGTFSFPALRD